MAITYGNVCSEIINRRSENKRDERNNSRSINNPSIFEAFLDQEAAKDRKLRERKVKKHCLSMIKHSTFHGLPFCFKKDHPLRRVFWTLLLLICSGLLIQKMFESTQNYLNYPFSTTRSMRITSDLEFPAVSLCNLNDMRYSQMLGTKLHEIIKSQNFNISGQLSGNEYKQTIRSANHKLENMLYDCRIDGRKCSSKDFTPFYHKQGDKCYTFNSGKPGYELIKVNNVGPNHALQLTINIEFWDYYVDVLESGVKLILHGQEETPVTMEGIVVSPGFITYVELKKQKVRGGFGIFIDMHAYNSCNMTCLKHNVKKKKKRKRYSR